MINQTGWTWEQLYEAWHDYPYEMDVVVAMSDLEGKLQEEANKKMNLVRKRK